MKKANWFLALAIIVVAVSLFIPLSKALFKNVSSSNETLSAASWDVSLNQTGVNSNLTLVPGGASQTYTLNIVSNSEVDARYSVILGNVPTGVEVSINGVDFLQPNNNNQITFSNAGTILYSSQQKQNTHTLTFRSSSGTQSASNIAVTVNVVIEQVL